MTRQDLFIGGKWVQGNGELLTSLNPATGEVIWEGAMASPEDVHAAVSAARAAAPSWARLTLNQRIEHLQAFADALGKSTETVAQSISQETGKPLWESTGEAKAMVGKIAISIEAYNDRCREVKKDLPVATAYTRHKPHGVLAVFGPFNFPGHLPNGHIVPALLAGNTVVFKPSEQTPLVGELAVKIWEQSGLPSGVLNLVQGALSTGKALAEHSEIDGLLFTGSSRTGLKLSESFGKHPEKILALEMGGNNPLVVLNAGDSQAAAYAAIQSAFITSGQRCTCARRIIVEEGAKGDAFIDELIKMTQAIRIGAYTDTPQPFIGPVISSVAADHVIRSQEQLEQAGGRPIVRSEILEEGSAFVSPGLIDTTNLSSRPDEEVFGPFSQVIRVASLDAAIEEANNTRYGLSAGILTDDEETFREFLLRSRAGIVNWNTQTTGAASSAPFGGVGLSGNHRPSAYYAADYCAYPVVSMESSALSLPETLAPGIQLAEV